MNYGTKISKLRKSKNITQSSLAEKLYVTDKTISSWESNRTEPSLEMIIELSKILECNISYLLLDNDNEDNIEMEIKIKLNKEEYQELKRTMKTKGKFIQESNQLDIYYQSNYLNDINNRSLRIRTSGNKKILTLKNYSNKRYSEEYNVEINNSNNLEKIFEMIGLKKIVEVKKIRRIYSYLDKYEISLDKVDNLGYYIEIEILDKNNKTYDDYDNLLKDSKNLGLNLNNIEQKKYPQLMIIEKENENYEVNI